MDGLWDLHGKVVDEEPGVPGLRLQPHLRGCIRGGDERDPHQVAIAQPVRRDDGAGRVDPSHEPPGKVGDLDTDRASEILNADPDLTVVHGQPSARARKQKSHQW